MVGLAVVRGVELLARNTRRRLRNRDVLLYAAGLTFYAALGLVPLLLIGLRLSAVLLGQDAVRQTGEVLARYTPSRLGVGEAVAAVAATGARAGWATVLVAIVPASLYSEGLVRALGRLTDRPSERGRSLRGRLYTALLVGVVSLAMVLLVTVGRPLAARSYGDGTPARLIGILIAFVVGWAGATALLCLIYRVFAPGAVRTPALVWGSAATGSWLSGQTLGFLLVVRLATGVGTAYGGSVLAGAAATVLFLLYLNNIVLLGGFALTQSIDRLGGNPLRLVRHTSALAGEVRGEVPGDVPGEVSGAVPSADPSSNQAQADSEAETRPGTIGGQHLRGTPPDLLMSPRVRPGSRS